MRARDWRQRRVSLEDRKNGRLFIYLGPGDLTNEVFDSMEATAGWIGFFDAEDGRGPYAEYAVEPRLAVKVLEEKG